MSKPLKPRQQSVLDFLAKTINEQGYAPSMREIGEAVGLESLSSVTHQLNSLAKSGHIKRNPKTARSIAILHAEDPA
jgi:repressor LexA